MTARLAAGATTFKALKIALIAAKAFFFADADPLSTALVRLIYGTANIVFSISRFLRMSTTRSFVHCDSIHFVSEPVLLKKYWFFGTVSHDLISLAIA